MYKRFAILLGVFMIFVNCDKLDELTKFDIEYSQRATIPSSTGVNLPIDVFTPEMETNSETKFAVNDTRKNLIEEITLTELEMIIISPDTADFSFLNSIEVYISADGLEEIQIAFLNEVPENAGNRITLDTSDIDLKDYIKKDEFSLRLNTVTDELISTDYELEVNSSFFVDAKILGL